MWAHEQADIRLGLIAIISCHSIDCDVVYGTGANAEAQPPVTVSQVSNECRDAIENDQATGKSEAGYRIQKRVRSVSQPEARLHEGGEIVGA